MVIRDGKTTMEIKVIEREIQEKVYHIVLWFIHAHADGTQPDGNLLRRSKLIQVPKSVTK